MYFGIVASSWSKKVFSMCQVYFDVWWLVTMETGSFSMSDSLVCLQDGFAPPDDADVGDEAPPFEEEQDEY